MKNIELKVKVDTLGNVREKLALNDAEEKRVLHQIDIYFNSEKGRLKLRQINEEEYELIYYERPDEKGSKVSTYEIVRLNKDDARRAKNILSATNGIKVVVEKKRELWIYKKTRIHLDAVDGLGEYMELETVVEDISMDKAQDEHQEVIKILGLDGYEKCEVSYSDLILGN